jgi:hypothetical protein
MRPDVDRPPGLPAPSPEADREELIEYLESDQLVSERSRPVQRRVLDRRIGIALWGLRLFVIVVGVMVIYTFFTRLS